MTALSDRIAFLEKTLTSNILSFAKGIEWTIDKQIELKILDFREPRTGNLNTNDLIGFNINFIANVFFPNFIGMGKAVIKGNGIIRQKRTDQNNGPDTK